MSVNGQDYRSNVYLLDGTLQNDFTNGPAGSAAGTALGMESIREFRVESNAYSAEFGRNYGGQINVLTKSGTNTLRGSAYEFHRNDALDAANYFDVAGKPDFTRNQFGGVARRTAAARPAVLLRRLRRPARERSARRSRASCPTTTRALGLLPDGPVDHQRRRPAVPGRHSRGQRPGRSAAAWPPTPSASSRQLDQTLLPGPPRLQRRRRAPVLRALHATTMASSGCRPTIRSSRARSSRRNQFFTGEYRNVLSDRTLQTAALRLQPHAHRPERRGEPRLAAAAVRGRPRPGRRHRHRRHAAVRSAELGESAAGAERLQRPVRHHAHARAPPAQGRRARRALSRLHDQPDVQPRDLHLRERARVPREPAAAVRRPDARRATSTATGAGRSSASTRRTASSSRRACRSTPACATSSRRCRSTTAGATRR